MRRGLQHVSAVQVPLTDRPFGEDHTQLLVVQAMEGAQVSFDAVRGALEILSGPPAEQAARVAGFLDSGEMRMEPETAASR